MSMNDKYTIADISRFLNISKSALRYYDSIGLCKPSAETARPDTDIMNITSYFSSI